MRQGFSLVELSIVLVILGLLVGGILTGQSLIRAAELRSVTTEYSQFQTAVMTFRDKYFALPGDMKNATDFWGVGTCPGTSATPATDKTTCNGDGDGTVEVNTGSSFEFYRFWQHLANAGLIEGTYTGVPASAGSWDISADNTYSGKLSQSAWTILDGLRTGGWYDNLQLSPSTKHAFNLSTLSGMSTGDILTPEEAWNLDTKLDDAIPSQGKVTTFDATYSNCAEDADNYALTDGDKECIIQLEM